MPRPQPAPLPASTFSLCLWWASLLRKLRLRARSGCCGDSVALWHLRRGESTGRCCVALLRWGSTSASVASLWLRALLHTHVHRTLSDWTSSNEKAVASLLHTLEELKAELSTSPSLVSRERPPPSFLPAGLLPLSPLSLGIFWTHVCTPSSTIWLSSLLSEPLPALQSEAPWVTLARVRLRPGH